jgi:chromosome segregation ATPase
MDPVELEKKLGELETQVAELTEARDEATKRAEEAEAEIAKAAEEAKKNEEEFIEIDGEQVAKSAVPAPLLKRLEAQQEAIEKMQAEREAEALAKRAESELPNLAGTAEQKGALLKAIDGMSEDAAKSLHEALKAADAAVSSMFKEVGKTASEDDGSASARLEKMAREHATEKGVPYETAFAEVVKTAEGRELRKQSRIEQ